MTDIKTCPLRPIDCMKEKCGWWLRGTCVIIDIALSLGVLLQKEIKE